MKIKSLLNRFILLCLLLLTCFSMQSQTIKWQDYSDKTFVYEISSKEAEKLIKSRKQDSLVLKMLHTQVASFTDKWENQPEQGHFIFVTINKNQLNFQYVPIIPFQLFLHKEYGVLTLQVVDKEDSICDNAKIRIHNKGWFNTRVHFDKESQTYSIEESSQNRNRLLTVELDKFKAIFDLQKFLVNSWYGSYYGNYDSPDFYSYMITDKNKYKPREIVRFKSYALSGSKRPLRKDLDVWLRTPDWKWKKITTVSPYNPGGYAGEIALHDSLKLRLDNFYSIELRDKKRVVARTNFRYEDYELHDIQKFQVELKNKVQFYPDTNRLEIMVTDANGLILQDMKAEVLIRRRSVSRSYVDILTIPDTIMFQQVALDNSAPTIVNIPPQIFGESDLTYEVQVKTLTVDNQLKTSTQTASFYRYHQQLDYITRNDTIRFVFNESGREKKAKAELSYNDSNEKKQIELPYEEPFSQKIKSYDFNIPESDFHGSIRTESINPKLNIEFSIVSNILHIKLINPLNLEVSWYFYQGASLKERGFGTAFDIEHNEVDLSVVHYVEIFYLMGGKEQVFRQTFQPKSEHLSVDIDLPERIFPGQTLDATITVKDSRDNPVQNVDLTAFAVNSQLNYHVPDLPYYGDSPRTREQRSSYGINKKNFLLSMPLDYERWNKIAGLDEMNYYRFTYPRNTTFTCTVDTPDSTTQFAPYIMKNGNAVDIYVIEVNDVPVYFSWAEQPQGYSFIAPNSRQQRIKLRLHDRAIVLEPMQLEKGKKTIISVDLDHLPKNARTVPLDFKDKQKRFIFSTHEANNYKKHLSRVPVAPNNDYTHLKVGNNVYTVFHPCLQTARRTQNANVLVGPISQGKAQYMNGVTYKHENGFRCEYDENVIYKYPLEQFYPNTLRFSSNNNFQQLNDFALTPTVLKEKTEKCKIETSNYHPRAIQISQNGLSLNFRLPEKVDSSGVSNLLLKEHKTGNIIFPNVLRNNSRQYPTIEPGIYDVILLYNSGKFLEWKNIEFKKNTYTEVDMTKLKINAPTEDSWKWLQLRTANVVPVQTSSRRDWEERSYSLNVPRPDPRNIVRGTVVDKHGEELIGVSVLIVGTTFGTITGIDGDFQLAVNYGDILQFSYVGFVTKKMRVNPGDEISVVLEDDAIALESFEVVGIGFGTARRSDLTGAIAGLSVRGASSIYGSATPPAPPEELENTAVQQEIEEAENKLYYELMQLNGLRSNFSDVGFWQPALVTDKKGEASFTVTFPDNITKWNAVIYAMNRRLQTGTLRQDIKSYKPLMAELRTPQFLVTGDSCTVVGNIRNYTKDNEITGNIRFTLNDADTLLNKNITFSSSHQDYIMLTPNSSDSITATYLFTRNDGYNDGEKRTITIEPQGTEIADGTLSILRNNDKLTVTADKNEDVYVTISAKQLDVYLDASRYLMGYRYACNEQLASKLIGLLNYKIYQQYKGEKFRYDSNVNDIIRRLLNNQNGDRLWSWFGQSSNTSYWMSAHVLRALTMAKNAGYTVRLNLSKIEQEYADIASYRQSSRRDIGILHALSEQNAQQDYSEAVKLLQSQALNLNDRLLLMEISQKQGLDYSTEEITKYLKKDAFGAVYIDDGQHHRWYSNELINTLIAYRIVKKDSTLQHLIEPMQMYILGTRRYGWNTYQAASAVAAVLPDIVAESGRKNKPATVIISGKENKTVTEYPYKMVLHSGEQLNIEKKDGAPLFYSAHSVKRVTEERIGDAFEVSTRFENNSNILIGGKPVNLNVTVKVKQRNAEHVMIEVPIPAGCSYASKRQSWSNREVYREHFKEKAVIFCESLPIGTYTFTIQLLPRYTGKYILNPAKVEMMYFPIINANNALRKVEIKE